MQISTAALSATDVDNTPSPVEDASPLVIQPAHGALKKSGMTLNDGSTFTQAELETGPTITYQHDGGETSTDQFVLSISDGSGGSVENTVFGITVTPVNDSPVNTVPAAQTTDEDTPKVFSTANSNGISVTDSDAANTSLQLTISVQHGTLTLGGTTGLSFTFSDGNGVGSGDGTADRA